MNVSTEYEYTFKLTFQAEWYDPSAEQKRKFKLSFFPCDCTIELFDLDSNRMFLKRSACEGLRLKDIFVGNMILVYGRQIYLKDYGDCTTQKFIGKFKEHTFAIIKPSGMNYLGIILDEIYKHGILIEHLRMAKLTRIECLNLYEDRKGDSYLPFVIEHMSSAPLVALELVGQDCIERWRSLMGPADPLEAKKTAPNSFRARYGLDLASNAVHGSSNYEDAVKRACFFFPKGIDKKPPMTTAIIKDTTLCIIKPHAIDQGNLGKIIDYINQSDFMITAMQMFYLSREIADEFLEVYKGVISDFQQFQNSYLNGPCVALEISGKREGMDVHGEFRRFCGPRDSDVAKQIRPKTIRGMFGVDKYRNAVHCTDLPDDTVLELDYFFKILDA